MDEIGLAALADEIEADWRQDPDTFLLHYNGGLNRHEAKLLTDELRRRGADVLVQPWCEAPLEPWMSEGD